MQRLAQVFEGPVGRLLWPTGPRLALGPPAAVEAYRHTVR